ncbi:MAG: MFS transporter [Rhodobacteraceae bacterium]|nr:MFS transporter [Paracoccaceae bacterium]
MKAGLALLLVAYAMSQFYRVFFAVLSPALARDIGAGPADLALASSLWFAVFAAMQIPVGWALDRVGPRRTVLVIFGVGASLGALGFALARTPLEMQLATALIGAGCAPVLMSAWFVLLRSVSAAAFAMLAGVVIGVGSVGNLAGSLPFAAAVEAWGWRASMAALAVLSAGLALGIAMLLRDPERVEAPAGRAGEGFGALLRMPLLWPIFALMIVTYAPSAGLRGLWIGPWAEQVHGLDAAGLGRITLVVAIAMTAGFVLFGPLARWTGAGRALLLGGHTLAAALCLWLWAVPGAALLPAVAAMSAIGFIGGAYALVIAHAQRFVPEHLSGRGLTLLNLMGIGGVGLGQFVTGRLFAGAEAAGAEGAAVFAPVFLAYGLALALGTLCYLAAKDAPSRA